MQPSGVESAIRELEKEAGKIQDAIGMLKKIQAERSAKTAGGKAKGGRRRLSAKARKRISEAAKRRWAVHRKAKGNSGKAGRKAASQAGFPA